MPQIVKVSFHFVKVTAKTVNFFPDTAYIETYIYDFEKNYMHVCFLLSAKIIYNLVPRKKFIIAIQTKIN